MNHLAACLKSGTKPNTGMRFNFFRLAGLLLLCTLSVQAQTQPETAPPTLFHLSFEKGFAAQAKGKNTPENKNLPALVDGIRGKAAYFEKGQTLQFQSLHNLNKQQGTLSLWVKMPARQEGKKGGPFVLFNENGPGTKGSLHYTWDMLNQRMRFQLRDPRESIVYYSKLLPSDQPEWHHLAITWNEKKGVSLYVDGQQASTGWMPNWKHQNHPFFFLGALNEKGEQAWNGALDEIYIYSREITEAEARQAYLQYRRFTAEVSIKDPFLSSGKAEFVHVALHNPGEQEIQLQQLAYQLSGPNGKVLESGNLPNHTLPGLKRGFVKIPLLVQAAGEYSLTVTYSEGQKTKMVTSPLHVLSTQSSTHSAPATQKLVAQIDAATRHPIAQAGSSTVVTSPLGKYRESGPARHNRFVLEFEVQDVNEPHVAFITFPDDKERTMEVLLQDFANTRDYQAHTGIYTGGEFPLSNRMQEHRIVFWPRSKRQAFIFMTAETAKPAAVKEIKIYRVSHLEANQPPTVFKGSAPARRTGLYYEDPVLNLSFGTSAQLDGFSQTTDRLISYLKSFGQTEFEYPIAWYAGPLYGTWAEPFQPDIDGAQGGTRPHPDGFPAYLLKRLDQEGMKFNAGLHIHTLPSLNKYALADSAKVMQGEETVINVNKDGKLWYGYWHGADPNYNAADPRVMQAVQEVVSEVCERYGQEPALKAVSLVITRPKLYTFASLESGYNDINLTRFQQESNIKIPGYVAGDPKRFSNSYNWLMANPAAKKAWIDWRCKVLYEHYNQMGNLVAAHRSDLKLILNLFVHLTHNNRLADYLNQNPVEVLREMGIDPALYKDNPNLQLNYTFVPADLRWKRVNYEPDTHEVNRTIMTAPEVVASLQPLKNVGVTIHDRYWEDPVGRTHQMEGLQKLGVQEFTWRVTTFNPVSYHSLEPYVLALNNLEATTITKGGYLIGTFGMEKEIQRFSDAFHALPAVKFEDVATATDPVRIRQQVVDGQLYFYVLNLLPTAVETEVRLLEKGELANPVTAAKTKRKDKLTVRLQPYDLQVFTSSSSTQRVSSARAEVDEAWVKKLEEDLKKLQLEANQKGLGTGKYAPYLQLAQDSWRQKHYSRLYFLLQEHWVREISEAGQQKTVPAQ